MRYSPPPRRSRSVHRKAVAGATALAAAAALLSSLPPAAAALPPAGAATGLADLAADPSALRQVPAQSRPKFRWWWPTDTLDRAEIDRELTAIKNAGFGGVELGMLRNGDKWGSAEFRADLIHALRKATSLGLTFDVTLGPGWPVSSPQVADTSKELSSQDLHYGTADVAGGSTYRGPVPDNPPPGADAHKRLIAVTAARVTSAEGKPLVLDPDSAVDLTSKVDARGTVRWTAPATGKWKIFGFWMRPTMQKNRVSGADEALVVDHLNSEAIKAALKGYDRQVFDAAAPLLRQNGGDVFEDSYELEHGPTAAGQSAVFWTRDLLKDLAGGRRRDAAALLPGLFEEIGFRDGAEQRIRNDYTQVVNRRLVTDHLNPISEWARRKGMTFRAQAYQGGIGGDLPTDAVRLASALPKADVESLSFGDPDDDAYMPGTEAGPNEPGSAKSRAVLDRYRQVVSGAHLSGGTEVSNELGAAVFGDHRQDPRDLKALADHSLAVGVDRMVLHGFAYKDYQESGQTTWMGWCPWCGAAFSFADSWNQDWPQFKALPRLTDYLARADAVVSTGRPRVDLTVLNSTSDVNGAQAPDPAGTPQDAFRKALSGAGYTWDSVTPASLPSQAKVTKGRLLPDGPAYKAVIVQDQEALPPDTAERLVHLARAGLPVVVQGAVPSRASGYTGGADADRRVDRAIGTLRKLANVRFVKDAASIPAALARLGVRADLSGQGVADIVPVHRRTATGDAWFLFNNSTRPFTGELTFRTTGAPTLLDLWTGQATRLGLYRRTGQQVTVRVRIPADDTAALVFGPSGNTAAAATDTNADEVVRSDGRLIVRDQKGGPKWVALPDGTRRTVALPAAPAPVTAAVTWKISATTTSPAGERSVALTSTLKPWTDIPQLKGTSGTAVYATSVQIPASYLTGRSGVRLSLGDFAGAVRAWINGTEIPVSQVPNAEPVDVTAALRPGANQVKIELSTTLNNALRTQALTGDPDYKAWSARPELGYGLLGPVVFKPYVEATVSR